MNKLQDTTFLSYLFTIILWGSAFPMIKIALNDFSAESLSAFRLIFSNNNSLAVRNYKEIAYP